VTVVGNVGDDLEVLGMHVSPDLDSIVYALAGLSDEQRGWGRADETWNVLGTAAGLAGSSPVQSGKWRSAVSRGSMTSGRSVVRSPIGTLETQTL